jgi:maltose alpha-D-glucosyltransferase/alpha-amylase
MSDDARHDAEIRAQVAAILATDGPRWLETQRWFADKGRSITRMQLDDLLVQRVTPDYLMLAVANVEFADGTSARYLLPLAIAANIASDAAIAATPFVSESHSLTDGAGSPQLGNWLLDLMAGRDTPGSDAWHFADEQDARDLMDRARAVPGAPMGAEQSNSSFRFDEALIVKLFRRLQPGPNPDEEMLRALREANFPRVPSFAGSASWRSADGDIIPIALAQTFVPNQGDGWTWMLRRIKSLPHSPSHETFDAERLLGRRTAELHLTLCDVEHPDFVPEIASAPAIATDVHRVQQTVEMTIGLLNERASVLPGPIQSRLPTMISGLRESTGRAEGFRAETGLPRIRVHGDFHLGQTLRTRDDDWMLIDFEGEPARPVGERRQRASALKDVAGMLRSFAYARGTAERELPVPDALEHSERIAAWERGARRAFLAGYRRAILAAEAPLVPLEDEAFSRALAAWELDKALYEIAYEARNRPHWLEIPLAAFRSGGDDYAPDATGAAPA